jgi:hypothetical protein
MLTLIAAAALAAQAPAAPATANPPMNHEQHMQMAQGGEDKAMDCCKDCFKDMAEKHGSEPTEHKGHSSH